MKSTASPAATIKRIREELGMTQQEAADKAGYSIQFYRTVEWGLPKISDKARREIARALGRSVWEIWPDACRRELDLFAILQARHGSTELKISEAQAPMIKEVLSRMSEDEFEELISSGVTPARALKAIKAFAKEHGIEAAVK